MKINIRLCVFITVVFFSLWLSKLNADPSVTLPDNEPEVSMDFQDANLKDIMKILSIQSGLNFIASEGVQDRKVTLYLDKVPLNKAMDKLFKANNLSYELYKDSNIFIVKDLGKIQTETITKVFYLKHATVSSSSLKEEESNQLKQCSSTAGASSGSGSSGSGSGKWAVEEDTGITKAVKKLLSEVGFVIEDFRTNSLIVTDTPMRMSVVSKVIASLDVQVPQVLLEVEMLDVSKNTVDKLGVNWPTSIASLDVTGARVTSFPFSGNKANSDKFAFSDITSPSGNWNFTSLNGNHFTPSIFTFIGANLTLDFLRSQVDTKFLARPKILTLNNEPAEIKITTQEAIGIKTSTTSATAGTSSVEAERTETGVSLRVTPQVNSDTGEITMMIYPKVSEAVQGNTFTNGTTTFNFRDPEERSTKSVVRMRDGETVVIGGLIRNESQRQETRLPVLGSIPIIGFLFKHSGGTDANPDKNKVRELLIFITPRIIKDTAAVNTAQAPNMEIVKASNRAIAAREQANDSGLGRSTSMSSVLNNFEKGR